MNKVLYAAPDDLPSWMELIKQVKWNFPGLDSEKDLQDYENTVLHFMKDHRALCIKNGESIIGVMLFSQKHNLICFLAVSPNFRRKGLAAALLQEALQQLDSRKPIKVVTFRKEDPKGTAPRALYEKFGFIPCDLIEEYGYPQQEFILPPK